MAKKDFDKAEEFLDKHGESFRLWLERAIWRLRLKYARGDITESMKQLEHIIEQNYGMKDNEF